MGTHKKHLLLTLLVGLILVIGTGFTQAQNTPSEPVIIYIFWGEGCPYCRAEHEFLAELKTIYPQVVVRDYEVYYNEDNRRYLSQMLAEYGLEPSGVPTTFINDRYWIGFSENIAHQLEATVTGCLQTTCADAGVGIIPIANQTLPQTTTADAAPVLEDSIITLPLGRTVNLSGLSLWLSTALIALVDGFNPCSLWVLSLLLALVIHSGSRQKTMIVGLTFLTVTSLVYVLFIVGLFSVFSFVGFMGWIQVAVALLALVFAVINIKDYFWYKQGVSLTIADKHKPKIYRDMRGLLQVDNTPTLIGATAVMAMGVTLVELPCTSGLPVLWTNIIATHQPNTLTFVLLLGLYMLIFLADELIVFSSVVLTLKASKFEEKQGRLLKLIGGMVMLVLAIVLLIDPAIMNNLTSSLLVFGVAMIAVLVVLVLHRYVLPHYGIYIGTEPLQTSNRKATHRV
jgi:thiol-disulfide isomerase/thioredoxin